jgi:peptidoglycan/LPS O-acetylase OafA/YrhL
MGQIIVRCGRDGRCEVVSFLKGFSIATIVLMHLIQGYLKSCPQIISRAAAVGGAGVHIFFLCSGFGLYLSYIRNPISYWAFLKKRFSKIYFPYIIVVTISAMIPFMYEGNHFRALLSHIFLYKMFMPQYESSFGGHLWFISTIIQFYLIFIPLCKLKERLNDTRFILMALIASMCWWFFTCITGLNTIRVWGSFFLQYLWEFALGMSFAQRLQSGKNIVCNRFSLLLVSVLGIGFAAAFSSEVLSALNDIFSMFGYLALALLVYSLEIMSIKRVVAFISKISYELYLVHILIFNVIFTLVKVGGWLEYVIGLFAVIIAILVAYVYHIMIRRYSVTFCKALRLQH